MNSTDSARRRDREEQVMTPHERAMEALRVRCKEVYQQLGRDAMLRQNDPVETLFAFAKELIDEHSYVIGWNDGWDESQSQMSKP